MLQLQNRRSRLVNLATRQEENVIYGQRATHLSEQNLDRPTLVFLAFRGFNILEVSLSFEVGFMLND
ncbi:hypothetical protein RHMOL_Rhmol11G0000700 [Rhododendron molle]|uniref:Uncharacterized protein n=1 Tax=Rhododendron molle TaxID=49168 RepID=A0ACC0LLX2_RHOML|nr:hypothetical protein RHMOL_Rhmol11G0000700 [Rhododendron molle]